MTFRDKQDNFCSTRSIRASRRFPPSTGRLPRGPRTWARGSAQGLYPCSDPSGPTPQSAVRLRRRIRGRTRPRDREPGGWRLLQEQCGRGCSSWNPARRDRHHPREAPQPPRPCLDCRRCGWRHGAAHRRLGTPGPDLPPGSISTVTVSPWSGPTLTNCCSAVSPAAFSRFGSAPPERSASTTSA